MNNYREVTKSSGDRILEFLQALHLIRDAIQEIQNGKTRYLAVLSGQLRSLLAERAKKESPLLFEITKFLGSNISVYCMPGVDTFPIPESIRDKITLHVSGPPMTLERKLPLQRHITLSEMLDEKFILFRKEMYSLRKILEWHANKIGGSHYSSRIPVNFASLKSITVHEMNILTNLLVQLGEITFAGGLQLIKEATDIDIFLILAIPNYEEISTEKKNYLFDSQYSETPMRISLTIDSDFILHLTAIGLDGTKLQVCSDRPIDWSTPRAVNLYIYTDDKFSTRAQLNIDGICVGMGRTETPLFILSNLTDHDICYNKGVNQDTQQFSFAMADVIIFNKEKTKERQDFVMDYLGKNQHNPQLNMILYTRGSFGESKCGSDRIIFSGIVRQIVAKNILHS